MKSVALAQLEFPIIRAHQQADWVLAHEAALPDSSIIQAWLLDPDSLTAKLKRHCDHFEVQVLGQQPG
ncbi:MAG: hypothetical protein B7X54_07410, partial [Idiomarina sp. 34-48-12]